MADDLRSWIVNSIIQHDKKHGAGLQVPCEGNNYCQLIEFKTFRDAQQPHNQIIGVVSDKTHNAIVEFNVDETDRFEESTHGIPSESLTSQLRAIFQLRSFSYRLERDPTYRHKPGTSPMLELPVVVLEVHKWTVVSGDRNDPVFFQDTNRIGLGKSPADAEVQRVLRKWWFGESYSDPSQNLSSQMETPSRPGQNFPLNSSALRRKPLMSSPAPPSLVQSTHETLTKFLKPYLEGTNNGKRKPIPEWIFEMPDEVQRQLDDINVFGLNLSSVPLPLIDRPEVSDVVIYDENFDDGKVPEDDSNHDNNDVDVDVEMLPAHDRAVADAKSDHPDEHHVTSEINDPDEQNVSTPALLPSPSLTFPPPGQRPPPTQTQSSEVDEEVASSLPESDSIPIGIEDDEDAEEAEEEEQQNEKSEESGDDDDDDDEMPIRPLARPVAKRKAGRKEMFDPTPEPSASISIEENDEDESGLSDYEREQRRRSRARKKAKMTNEVEEPIAKEANAGPSRSVLPAEGEHISPEGEREEVAEDDNESENEAGSTCMDHMDDKLDDKSLSASQQSHIDFSLSKYTFANAGDGGAVTAIDVGTDAQTEATQTISDTASPTKINSGYNDYTPPALLSSQAQTPPSRDETSTRPPITSTSSIALRRSSPSSPIQPLLPFSESPHPITCNTQETGKGNEADISGSYDAPSLSLNANRQITRRSPEFENSADLDNEASDLPPRKKTKLQDRGLHTPALSRASATPASAAGSSARGSRRSFLGSIKMLIAPSDNGNDSPSIGKGKGKATDEREGGGGVLSQLTGWLRGSSVESQPVQREAKPAEVKVKVETAAIDESSSSVDEATEIKGEIKERKSSNSVIMKGQSPEVKEKDFALLPPPSDITLPNRQKSQSTSNRYHLYSRPANNSRDVQGSSAMSSPTKDRLRVGTLPGFELDLSVDGLSEDYVRRAMKDVQRRRGLV